MDDTTIRRLVAHIAGHDNDVCDCSNRKLTSLIGVGERTLQKQIRRWADKGRLHVWHTLPAPGRQTRHIALEVDRHAA